MCSLGFYAHNQDAHKHVLLIKQVAVNVRFKSPAESPALEYWHILRQAHGE